MINDSANNGARQPIKDEFLNVLSSNIVAFNSWLGPTNRYGVDTINRLRDDTSNSRVNENDLKEYVAASSVIHCKDGWSFLGNAIESLLTGRTSHAIHLAYYAELRAAMSFLASFGIGVFHNRHCYIDNNGNVNYRTTSTAGTHDFVWKVLEKWADNPARARDIIGLIEIDGKNLYDWILSDTTFLSQVTAGHIGSNWLKLWSMDIEKLSKDRHIRNEGSYRPINIDISRRYAGSLRDELNFVLSQWTLCEPNASRRFDRLDLYLLREIIERSYQSHYGKSPNSTNLRDIYIRMIGNLGVSRNTRTESFLTKKIDKNKSIVMKAAKLLRVDSNGRPRPISVLSRAFLLLRISTSAVKDSLNYSNINFDDYSNWIKYEGTRRGLWPTVENIEDPDDLWTDVEDSNEIILNFLQGSDVNRFNMMKDVFQYVNILSQKERVFFWGIK
jgi:hypothetical protein